MNLSVITKRDWKLCLAVFKLLGEVLRGGSDSCLSRALIRGQVTWYAGVWCFQVVTYVYHLPLEETVLFANGEQTKTVVYVFYLQMTEGIIPTICVFMLFTLENQYLI